MEWLNADIVFIVCSYMDPFRLSVFAVACPQWASCSHYSEEGQGTQSNVFSKAIILRYFTDEDLKETVRIQRLKNFFQDVTQKGPHKPVSMERNMQDALCSKILIEYQLGTSLHCFVLKHVQSMTIAVVRAGKCKFSRYDH